MDETILRGQLCTACHQMWLRNMLVGDEGLVSVGLHRRRFLTLPQGRRRAELSPDDLICVDLGGDDVQSDIVLPADVWHPHRLAYQFGIDRETNAQGERFVPLRATAFVLPVHLMALLGQEQSVVELPFAGLALSVAEDRDDAMLKSGLQAASAVALRRDGRVRGLLVVGPSLESLLNLAERIEHAAAIELSSPAHMKLRP